MTNASKDYKSKELIIVLLRTTKLKIKVGGSNPTNTKVRIKFLTVFSGKESLSLVSLMKTTLEKSSSPP